MKLFILLVTMAALGHSSEVVQKSFLDHEIVPDMSLNVAPTKFAYVSFIFKIAKI